MTAAEVGVAARRELDKAMHEGIRERLCWNVDKDAAKVEKRYREGSPMDQSFWAGWDAVDAILEAEVDKLRALAAGGARG